MSNNEQQQTPEEEKDQTQVDYEEGQRFLSEGSHAQAANAFHNALLGYEEKGDEKGIANTNDKLGDVCMARGEFDKAIIYFEHVQNICEKFEDLFSIISIQKKIASCHKGSEQYDKAIAMYIDLLETYEKVKNPRSAVSVLELMADTYSEMGELEKAADTFRTVASIHKNFGHSAEEKAFLEKAEEMEKEMEERS